MYKYLTIFLLAIIGFTSCKKKQADVLADIKEKTAKINKGLTSLSRKQVDDIMTPGGGTIMGYYDGEEVKKINVEQYTDTCRIFSEFYFDDGMLIYVLEHNYVYNKPRWYTEELATEKKDSVWYDDKKTVLVNNRYYLKQNKLIKWIKGDDNDIMINSSEFINMEPKLWIKAVLLIKELKELKSNQ